LGTYLPCHRGMDPLGRSASETLPEILASNSAHSPRDTRFWGCYLLSVSQRPREQGRTGIIPHHVTDGETEAKIITVMK